MMETFPSFEHGPRFYDTLINRLRRISSLIPRLIRTHESKNVINSMVFARLSVFFLLFQNPKILRLEAMTACLAYNQVYQHVTG